MKKLLVAFGVLMLPQFTFGQNVWNFSPPPGPFGPIWRDGPIGVGFGSFNPAYLIDVYAGVDKDGVRVTQTNIGASAVHLNNTTSNPHGNTGNLWSILSSGVGNESWLGAIGNFAISENNGNPSFLINGSNGNVGINTNAPVSKLEVVTLVAGDGITISQKNAGSAGLHLNPSSGRSWSLYSTGVGDGWGGPNHFAIQKTPDANPAFYINGNSGNVDIAPNFTVFPGPYVSQYRLSVNTTSADDGIGIIQNGGSGSCALHLTNYTAQGQHWAIFSTGNGSQQGSGNFSIYEYGATSPDRLFINGSTGNVGIGNNTPGAKLHIQTSNAPTGTGLYVDHNYTGNYGFAALVNVHSNLTKAITVTNQVGTPAETFKVMGDGTTYIGSKTSQSHPLSKLSVAGTIVCQEIFVTAPGPGGDWADYVFDKGYKLMPLDKLNSYVTEYHHLPNVPSASEIKKNDLSLGEMSKIQMEKIEELTLYILELKKEIEALKETKEKSK